MDKDVELAIRSMATVKDVKPTNQLIAPPKNVFQRLLGATKGFVNGWMGPGRPFEPIAPEGTPPRKWDYPIQSNIQISPRQDEEVSFAVLRAVAKRFDLYRIILERRKSQMVMLEWDIQPIDPKNAKAKDGQIDEIKALIKCPDGEMDYQQWTRSMLEEMFVIDAFTVEPVLDSKGRLIRLFQIDGATITPKIDERGRRPLPPATAYQQVILGKGVASSDFTADELIYYPQNLSTNSVYGFSTVEQILTTINIGMRRMSQQLYSLSEGSVPEALLTTPEGYTAANIAELQSYYDTKFSGNLKARSRMTVVPHGSSLIKAMEEILKNEGDEWLARLCCFVMGVSPNNFTKQVNRATAETSKKEADQEGLQPVQAFVKGFWDLVLKKYWKRSDLNFAWTEPANTDAKTQADIDVESVKVGLRSVDELRIRDGLDPIGMGQAIFLPTGVVFVKDLLAGNGTPQGPAQPLGLEAPKPEAGDKGGEAPAEKVAGKKKLRTVPRLPLKDFSKRQKELSASVHKVFKKYLGKTVDAIWKRISVLPASKAAGDDNSKQAQEIADAIQLDFFTELIPKVKVALQSAAKDSAKAALVQVGGDLDAMLDQVDEAAVKWAGEHAAEMVGMKYVGGQLVENPDAAYSIEASTRDMLKSQINQALTEGWSKDTLGKAITEGPFSDSRADTIAQTELQMAHATANMDGWRASGQVSGKQWLLSDDHEPFDECDANEYQGVIGLDEDFDSGDDTAPAHPNCWCSVVAVLGELEDLSES
jgi:Phage portal protein/Phage Mu protein F like protein